MIIRDILTTKRGDLLSVTPGHIIQDAIAIMTEADIGSLIVFQHDIMVGLITERDILRGLRRDGAAGLVATVDTMMVTEPIFAVPDDTVDYVRGVMTKNRISHLLVMENDHLIGVISFHDVARACMNAADFENQLLTRYIKHWPEA